jgi:Fe-S oxidoreductase
MAYELEYSKEICAKCETFDCLVRCQYLDLDLEAAREERQRILDGEYSRVLSECATCYACEEYCPYDNYPFYLIAERQEELETWPVPIPLTKQQIKMMGPRRRITPQKVTAPVINMCFFPMLTGCIRGKLFEGASTISGSDIFCNIMWLHFAKNSVIRERLPKVIKNIMSYYLEESGVDELICFHDECYGTYTHLAPAFGIEVPFKPVHLFEYITRRLTELKDQIRPINQRVVYQRPCSNRLVPETQHWVDEIFELIGVERVERQYDRENALCCGMTIRAAQRDDLADDIQEKNLDDMEAVDAKYCVFNCPACFFGMRELVTERGMIPILMSDLCQIALGEPMGW